MTIPNTISSQYHCPRCRSPRVYEGVSTIFCPKCKLTFDLKMLALFEDDNVMSNEELEGITHTLKGDDDEDDDLSLFL